MAAWILEKKKARNCLKKRSSTSFQGWSKSLICGPALRLRWGGIGLTIPAGWFIVQVAWLRYASSWFAASGAIGTEVRQVREFSVIVLNDAHPSHAAFGDPLPARSGR